jgi:hypothetical protein
MLAVRDTKVINTKIVVSGVGALGADRLRRIYDDYDWKEELALIPNEDATGGVLTFEGLLPTYDLHGWGLRAHFYARVDARPTDAMLHDLFNGLDALIFVADADDIARSRAELDRCKKLLAHRYQLESIGLAVIVANARDRSTFDAIYEALAPDIPTLDEVGITEDHADPRWLALAVVVKRILDLANRGALAHLPILA